MYVCNCQVDDIGVSEYILQYTVYLQVVQRPIYIYYIYYIYIYILYIYYIYICIYIYILCSLCGRMWLTFPTKNNIFVCFCDSPLKYYIIISYLPLVNLRISESKESARPGPAVYLE